jgi:RNA polymerase sigma-70 factor (sigma-E family)
LHPTTEADFRAFMTARWSRLLRTAFLLTGHHQDAEDLAQSALARACARWERVMRARDPDAYVWRIMINLHRDRMRRAGLRERLTGRPPDRSAADHSDELVVRGVLLDALRRLPARQRAVVVLRYLEDRTESQVATLLGTGVGTVRSQTYRALARLRRDGAVRDITDQEGAPS